VVWCVWCGVCSVLCAVSGVFPYRLRRQEPISADATVKDREIAELIRYGLIGGKAL